MNEAYRADLHCHSIYSDGSDTPIELLHLAKKSGLQGLSITDHDTFQAYSREFFLEAEKLGIAIIPGIELSTEYFQHTIHILGYGFDLESDDLKKHVQEMQNLRNHRNHEILKKLAHLNIHISLSELEKITILDERSKSVGRPHIAQALLNQGVVTSIQEAFEKFLAEGACCYVGGFHFTPEETIQVIHKAGGKAVLAHPHVIKNASILGGLLNMPFDGLECYYGCLPAYYHFRYLKIAKSKNWIITGGSDYHGSFKPYLNLGSCWVNQETVGQLIKRDSK